MRPRPLLIGTKHPFSRLCRGFSQHETRRGRPSPSFGVADSNRSWYRLEFYISPTKQRTEALSNRSKSGRFYRRIQRKPRSTSRIPSAGPPPATGVWKPSDNPWKECRNPPCILLKFRAEGLAKDFLLAANPDRRPDLEYHQRHHQYRPPRGRQSARNQHPQHGQVYRVP